MIPAKYRGRVDIGVNGTYWAGSIIGTLVSLLFLNVIGQVLGWRFGFLIGPALAVVIIYVRRALPESPRWLLTHGRAAEAEQTITGVEQQVQDDLGKPLPPADDSQAIEVRPVQRSGYLTLLHLLFTSYRRRAVLGASLLITQSFLYNAIFFTYTLVLTRFYNVSETLAPAYLIAFAVGNLAGPLTIGRLFDTIGRKPMISATYIGSGAMLAITAWLFDQGALTAVTQTIAWCVIFFFASAGRLRRVPDRQRDLPAGGLGGGDRSVLRHRPVLRRHRPHPVRRAHRRGQRPVQAVHRLSHRRRRDDRRRRHRTPARRPRPAETPRGRRPAPVRGRPPEQGRLLPRHAAFRDRRIGRCMNGKCDHGASMGGAGHGRLFG
jgi:MFS family permease